MVYYYNEWVLSLSCIYRVARTATLTTLCTVTRTARQTRERKLGLQTVDQSSPSSIKKRLWFSVNIVIGLMLWCSELTFQWPTYNLVDLMPIGLTSFPLKFLGQHWCKLHEQFCGLSLQVLSIWRIVLLSIICLFISLWREYSVLSLAVLGVDLKPLTEVGVWSCSNIQNPVFQSLHAFRLSSCTITCLLLNKSEAIPHWTER